MRTKNAKRLWPVPATLAVMALAAFLAFGLMATNGAQPAAAQSDDPCFTVTAGTGAIASQTPTVDADANNADGNDGCNSAASPAVVKLVGPSRPRRRPRFPTVVIYGPDIGGSGTHVPIRQAPSTAITTTSPPPMRHSIPGLRVLTRWKFPPCRARRSKSDLEP